jgi:hypothetical protein
VILFVGFNSKEIIKNTEKKASYSKVINSEMSVMEVENTAND